MRNLMAGLTVLRFCIKSICLALCLCAMSQAAEDPSLVLYFDFEEGGGDTVKDRSGYGNDGTIEGDAARGDGKIGKGLEIDIGSFVLVPDSDDFKITDELTLACWVKPTAFAPEAWQGNTLDFLVCRWNWGQGDHRCYEMYLQSHKPAMVVSSDGTDGGGSVVAAAEPIALDQWVNIMGIFDGSKVKIYVDGEEKGSEDHKGNILAGEGPIVIGDNNFGGAPDFHFVGVIDEVAVYDRVLNQNEIEAKIARGHAASVEPEGKLSTVWAHVKSQYQKF